MRVYVCVCVCVCEWESANDRPTLARKQLSPMTWIMNKINGSRLSKYSNELFPVFPKGKFHFRHWMLKPFPCNFPLILFFLFCCRIRWMNERMNFIDYLSSDILIAGRFNVEPNGNGKCISCWALFSLPFVSWTTTTHLDRKWNANWWRWHSRAENII